MSEHSEWPRAYYFFILGLFKVHKRPDVYITYGKFEKPIHYFIENLSKGLDQNLLSFHPVFQTKCFKCRKAIIPNDNDL